MAELFFSERRAAVRLGIARSTLRRYREAGHVRPLCLGGAVLYGELELERFKTARLTPRNDKEQV
jgi:predicted site-specific integrase-resolvase